MSVPKGIFTISLDFELYWGVRDHRRLEDYGDQVRKVHTIVPRMLDLFKQYGIHATWATVGFLFSENKAGLEQNFPASFPDYQNPDYDPYLYIKNNELAPEYHFAPGLIEKIRVTPGQEIATHTYSHFYALEKNTTSDQFRNDLIKALETAERRGFKIKTIVFPRNQYGEAHIEICGQLGIKVYRGNVDAGVYSPAARNQENLFRRGVRFLDAYLNLTGKQCYLPPAPAPVLNLPASRFLRPYRNQLKRFETLKYQRIKKSMEFAGQHGRIYHLWWHPHNFGSHTEENFRFLEKILELYADLHDREMMESKNMGEIYEQTLGN